MTTIYADFNFCSYLLGFISTLITGGIVAYFTHFLTKKRELKYQSIKAFKLISALSNEVDLFLKSQKHFCGNYEEYRQRDFHGQGFEPVENLAGAINLKNKSFLDFFSIEWLDKFYYFFAFTGIIFPDLSDDLNSLFHLVEEIYPKREICTITDEYQEFYNYIDKELKIKLDNIHMLIRKKITE